MGHCRRIARTRLFFLAIGWTMSLVVAKGERVIAQPFLLAGLQDEVDVPVCFMKTSNGRMVNLERLCGKGAYSNGRPRPPIFVSKHHIDENLQWERTHPSSPVSDAPTPYDAQSMKDFDKLLYGD